MCEECEETKETISFARSAPAYTTSCLQENHGHTLNLSGTEVEDFSALAGLSSLLDLSGTNVTDAGIAALTRLSRLHTLRLKGTKVTDAGMFAFLTALKNYRFEAGITRGLKYCL